MNRDCRRLLLCLSLAVWPLFLGCAPGTQTITMELKQVPDRPMFPGNKPDPKLAYLATNQQFFIMHDGEVETRRGDPQFKQLVKKEPPKYLCKEPFRLVARLGSENYLIALDASDRDRTGYDLLYFDRNHNGDLTDDDVVRARPLDTPVPNGAERIERDFPLLQVTLTVDGKQVDFALRVSVYWTLGTRTYVDRATVERFYQVVARLGTASYREGQVMLDGRRHRIMLLDFNSNQRFDDQFAIDNKVKLSDGRVWPRNGDLLLVDPDPKDASFGYQVVDRRERQYVSKLVNIGERFYELEVTPTGETLKLTPSRLPVGSVVHPNLSYVAVVYSNKGFVKITGTKGKPVHLPAGEWKLLNYNIDLAESAGVKAWGTRDFAPIRVVQGKTAVLPFGPPYRPVVRAVPWGKGEVQLELGLVGAAGEVCTDLNVKGKRPDPPTFTIATPKGEVVAQGKFEFG